jgi:hypothetical protein
MPFNIDTFRNQIANKGYLTNNKFEVIVTPPPMILGGFFSNLANFNFGNLLTSVGDVVSAASVTSQLKYRIDQIRVPGVSLMSADVQRYGSGTTQKMPFQSQMNEITISMTSDGFGDIWQFWYNWLRGINEFTGTTSSLIGVGTSLPSYTTEYKDNYSTTMEIVIYDPYGMPTIKIDLFEAFPVAIRDIPLSWGDSGNLMSLNVSISFTDFTIVGANFASPYTLSNAIGSIGSILNGAYMNNTYTNNLFGGMVQSSNIPPSPGQPNINAGGASRETVNIS